MGDIQKKITNAAGNIFNLPQPDANVTAFLKLAGGKQYELAFFRISFTQPTDYKGEPQGEVAGGHISISMSQVLEEEIFQWAVSASKRRNGVIEFRAESSSAPMKVEFNDGYCVNFEQKMSAVNSSGTETTLIISAEEIIVNGIDINKFWTK